MNKLRLIKKSNIRASAILDNILQKVVFSSRQKLPPYLRLFALNILLNKQRSKLSLGALWTKPTFISKVASFIGLGNNLNNLGNVYASNSNYGISKKLEREVVEWTKGIFRYKKQSVEGYITSGGTESNLFLAWVGREWLRNKLERPCTLILSDFTHYSIRKAGRILDLKQKRVFIDEKSLGIDSRALENKLIELYKGGIKNILLPITLGYSSTGAYDPLKEMLAVIRKADKSYKDFNIFVWIDAATQGLPETFLNKNFRPLSSTLVQGLVVDFHKLGGVPIPAGVVLYRRYLRKMIQMPIDYLSEDDATISGSRPGFSGLAIWSNIISKDKKWWKSHFTVLNSNKEDFIKKFIKYFPKATILSTNNSLTCAIVVNRYFRRLPESIESKFSLNIARVKYRSAENRTERYLEHYKLNFLSEFDPLSFLKDLKTTG